MSQFTGLSVEAPGFFAENDTHLRSLLGALGMSYPETSAELVGLTQPWLQGDHINTDVNPYATTEQQEAAHALFARLDMYGQHLPPADVAITQADLIGGLATTNQELPKWLRGSDMALTDDAKIVAWLGPRTPDEKEYPAIQALLDQTEFTDDDPWVIRQHADEQDPSKVDELAQGALGLSLAYGQLALKYAVLREDHTRPGAEVPPHLVNYYVFEAEQSAHDIVLLNGTPVARNGGASRHTTISCADEWLAGPFAPTTESDVAIVTGSPYTPRITQNIRDRVELRRASHPITPHITVHGTGPAELAHIHDGIRRGELARRIYDAHKRQPATL